ncbi:MAG: caspase family protein, partial [Pseudomonadales bacterium]|nr:caspase family protein [Pseudomonadales bacterium]
MKTLSHIISKNSLKQKTLKITGTAVFLLTLSACTTGNVDTGQMDKSQKSKNRVAELQIVDCLLPGQVRRLGTSTYVTPRRPILTTAADCSLRGGEYVAYDRADYKTALKVWLSSAEQGDAAAQVDVGEIFEKGLGGEPNYTMAIFWYKKAAKQGSSRAQFNLGTLYEQGLGVKKDGILALNWYRQALNVPKDDLLFASAANAQQATLRDSLEKELGKKNSQIRLLKKQLSSLQKEFKILASHAQNESSMQAIEKDIDALKRFIADLDTEHRSTQSKLALVPKLRTPHGTLQVSTTQGQASQTKVKDLNFGKYYALIIGNQQYDNIDDLDTPQNDAEEIASILKDKYGFEVQVILNSDNIALMEAFNNYSKTLTEEDNLLVYYAGHGTRIKSSDHEAGYWLPTNAEAPPRDTYWVSNEFITRHLSRAKAKRVLVIADSCYAGLLSSAPGYLLLGKSGKASDDYIRYKLNKRSRLLLSSGGDFPVLDNGGGKHSIFA